MKIAVLGCGPAGLFAVHAASTAGHDVVCFSRPRKSFMRGAQYLHRPIPGLSVDPFKIEYSLEGTIEGYRTKVYGDMSDINVSPETLVGVSDAWDIREAYDAAWERYGSGVYNFQIADTSDRAISDIVTSSDLVISTVPARILCQNPTHEFIVQKVWSTDFVRSRGDFQNDQGEDLDNLVVCSGDPSDWWYRASRIQGWENTEYPHDRKPNTDRVWEIEKPILTDCSCHPDIRRMGRYGAWKKGVLSDAAYYDTLELLRGKTL